MGVLGEGGLKEELSEKTLNEQVTGIMALGETFFNNKVAVVSQNDITWVIKILKLKRVFKKKNLC